MATEAVTFTYTRGSVTYTKTVNVTDPVVGDTFGNASNTGPVAGGWPLPTAAYTGPMRIQTAGTVITNKVIPAGMVITANNVTIQGCIIEGPTDLNSDQAALEIDASGAKILYNLIRGKSSTTWQGNDPISGVKIYGNNITFSYNNCYYIAGDGITIDGENFTGIGNWVHDFVLRSGGAHYDGFHYPKPVPIKTQPALIQDNRIEMWIALTTDSGMTTALGLPEETGSGGQIVVNHNVIAGGGYALEGGGPGTKITNNLFWTKFSPNVGYYGVHTFQRAGYTWTGNTLTSDGVTPGAPVS